jgi:hypothetical protein
MPFLWSQIRITFGKQNYLKLSVASKVVLSIMRPRFKGDELETTESLATNRVNQFVAYTVNV